MIHKHQGNHCNRDEGTDGGNKKWFPGMLPIASQTLAKVYQCPRKLLCRKCSVNRCNITYFGVLNQFLEIFEPTCIFSIQDVAKKYTTRQLITLLSQYWKKCMFHLHNAKKLPPQIFTYPWHSYTVVL
jgi:hypothetical protein